VERAAEQCRGRQLKHKHQQLSVIVNHALEKTLQLRGDHHMPEVLRGVWIPLLSGIVMSGLELASLDKFEDASYGTHSSRIPSIVWKKYGALS
jgi:hypothetical protein